MDHSALPAGVLVRDNGLYDGAWRYTVEVPSSDWRLHLAPSLDEFLWLHEPGGPRTSEPRCALTSLPAAVRLLAESALAAGPPRSGT